MEQLFLTLRLDLSNEAPAGAGWYVQAVADKQLVISPTYVDTEAATILGQNFLAALQTSDAELPPIPPTQLVQSGNGLIKDALERQLRYAEDQAAKIANLRRRLGMIPKGN